MYYALRILEFSKVFKFLMYTHTYYVLDFSNFETNFFWRNVIFSSNLTLKTASGRPECKDDMDDAAIVNVQMQSFS